MADSRFVQDEPGTSCDNQNLEKCSQNGVDTGVSLKDLLLAKAGTIRIKTVTIMGWNPLNIIGTHRSILIIRKERRLFINKYRINDGIRYKFATILAKIH